MVRLRAVMVTKNAGEQGEKQEYHTTRDVLYCGTKQLNLFLEPRHRVRTLDSRAFYFKFESLLG